MEEGSKRAHKLGSYLLTHTLGVGLFGEVFLASSCNAPGHFALKRINKLSSRYNKYRVQNEVQAGELLSHDGIVKFLHYFEKTKHFCLVFELIEGLSLIEVMEERNFEPFEERMTCSIVGQLVAALAYCHSKGVAHRDIKLDNILLTESGTAKLIDFGLCELDAEKKLCNDAVGSIEYCAPEVLQGRRYSAFKADVWSCGVVAFALLFGEFPFSDEDRRRQQLGENVSVQFEQEDFENVSLDSIDLIRCTLRPCETRPMIDQLTRHSWLNRVKNQNVNNF